MISFTATQSILPPSFCIREILRYAGCKGENEGLRSLMEECIKEAEDKLSYRVCYRKFPVTIEEDRVCFDFFSFSSCDLAKNLNGCKEAVFFAATVGLELDRLIAKYGCLSPSKALFMQAIGAERVEALCDSFCRSLAETEGKCLSPRFSPGYGDLPLEAQKVFFSVLECEKRIGLTLNDSLLMSPTKSVTAVVGIGGKEQKGKNKCSACSMQDCSYRGVL